jgi:hypothetical protein
VLRGTLYGSRAISLKSTQKADVAQLVEQSIRNRQVIGSSPIVGSIPSVSPLAHSSSVLSVQLFLTLARRERADVILEGAASGAFKLVAEN